MKKQKTEQQVADKMINIMQDAGLSPDDMLRVIALAREKYNEMKKQKSNNHEPIPSPTGE